MKPFVSLLVILLLTVSTLSVTQNKSSRSRRSRKSTSALLNPRVLNRELAAHLLRPIPSKLDNVMVDGFDLAPVAISPQRIRKSFAGYRIAEMAGWITMEVQGEMTVFQLTELGRRVFEEIKHPDIQKTDDGSYQFTAQRRNADRKITGITFINPNEAVVEYSWVWLPSDLVKNVLSPVETPCSARFALYDDGWRISMMGTCDR